MAELDALDTRARLAVLAVMGWDDDRDHPGTEDGVPPAACWTLAGELVAAVAPLVRRQVAEEIATAIDEHRLGDQPGFRSSRLYDLAILEQGVIIARQHADHTTTDQGDRS